MPSSIAAVLFATTPLWTALLQICIFRMDSFRWSLACGIVLGLVGVVTLVFGRKAGLNLPTCLAILGSCHLAIRYRFIQGPRFTQDHVYQLRRAQMLLGGLMLLLCSAVTGDRPCE